LQHGSHGGGQHGLGHGLQHGLGGQHGLQHFGGQHGLGHGLQQGSRSPQQQLTNTNAVAAKAIIELKKPAFFIYTLLWLGFVFKVVDSSNI
jgi:hypothetical protein